MHVCCGAPLRRIGVLAGHGGGSPVSHARYPPLPYTELGSDEPGERPSVQAVNSPPGKGGMRLCPWSKTDRGRTGQCGAPRRARQAWGVWMEPWVEHGITRREVCAA